MISILKGFPFASQMMLIIKSMGWHKGNNGFDYLELSLSERLTKDMDFRLTLREQDASKMYLKIGSGILLTVTSVDYTLSPEELEQRRQRRVYMPGNKHYCTRVDAVISHMHLELSASDKSPKVADTPFEYYLTTFRIVDYDGISSAPMMKDFARDTQMTVGDKVRLTLKAPMR